MRTLTKKYNLDRLNKKYMEGEIYEEKTERD